MPTIALSNFFSARYSACIQKVPVEEILRRVQAGFDGALPGYRDGVVTVQIDPAGFLSSVVDIQDGETLKAEYVSRVPGETPRKFIYVERAELPAAKRADVVLYRADVLAEDGDRSSEAEWEVVMVLPHCGDIPLPLSPDTHMANHFHLSGGTVTNMSPEEFVKQLEVSVRFWAARATARLV